MDKFQTLYLDNKLISHNFAIRNITNIKTMNILKLLICMLIGLYSLPVLCKTSSHSEEVRVKYKNKVNLPERSGTYYIIYAELNTETASLVIPLPDDFGEASIRIVRCADEAVMQTCTADAAAGKVTLRVDYAPGSYRIELESDAYTGEGHFTLP